MQITKPQLGRLQTLYAQFARREIGVGVSRAARIAWATERLHKSVSSFSDLTMEDAGWLIDQLQQQLGIKAPLKSRPDRDQARRAGLDGRKDGAEFAAAPQMATAQDLRRIQAMISQLGWSHDTYANFIASQRSPLAKRADKQIRTTADANKVWWALKRIAQQKGVWRKTA
jgi:hypothetical protein